MKNFTITVVCIFMTCVGYCQQVFFKSSQAFTPEHLKSFYASVNTNAGTVVFNAPDYQLYAYNKATGDLLWKYDLKRKSDVQPQFVSNKVWANNSQNVIALDASTGMLAEMLPMTSIETAPYEKDGLVYGTGLNDGGRIYAYDPAKKAIAWSRFLAHGSSIQPQYLPTKIVVNVEGNNWLEISYDGKLATAECSADTTTYPSELPCAKSYVLLAHNGKQLKEWPKKVNIEESETPVIAYAKNRTLVLNNNTLYVLGNNLKLTHKVDLDDLVEGTEVVDDGPARMLKTSDDKVWILLSQQLIEYDLTKQKTSKTADLSNWNPHSVLMDSDALWVISRTDGLLYGLR
jgi:outer membrane protein assembly factor BamB